MGKSDDSGGREASAYIHKLYNSIGGARQSVLYCIIDTPSLLSVYFVKTLLKRLFSNGLFPLFTGVLIELIDRAKRARSSIDSALRLSVCIALTCLYELLTYLYGTSTHNMELAFTGVY